MSSSLNVSDAARMPATTPKRSSSPAFGMLENDAWNALKRCQMTPFPTTRLRQNNTLHWRLRMLLNDVINGAKMERCENDTRTVPEPHMECAWNGVWTTPVMAPWVVSLAGAKWCLNDVCSGIPNPPLALDLLFVFIKKKVLVKMGNATRLWYQLLDFYILH